MFLFIRSSLGGISPPQLVSRQSVNLLPRPLQLSVQPAVSLFMDDQRDDVAIVKAEESVVVARRVGKDGPHSGSPGHVETR